jgi:hypothetical protein
MLILHDNFVVGSDTRRAPHPDGDRRDDNGTVRASNGEVRFRVMTPTGP